MTDEKDNRKLDDAKKVLLAQAKALGVLVDKRWSVDTLAEKVLEAEEDRRLAEKAAAEAEADTWVFLLRDGFPTEDEKRLAGETVKVSKAIAERWYVAGVARPGVAPVNG